MRTSLLPSMNFFPGCDVKYLAPGRCDASGGLYRPRALTIAVGAADGEIRP